MGCQIWDNTKWIPLSFIDGLPSININLCFEGENYQTNVWLDRGSDRCLDLSTQFIEQQDLQGKQKPWVISEIAGMEGVEVTIEEVFADKVQIPNPLIRATQGCYGDL